MAKKAKKKPSSKGKQASKPTPKRQDYSSVLYLFLALFVLIIATAMRYYAFGAPIMGDEAVYAILGKKAIMGEVPFTDFYEMKPPLLYYCYGIGSLLFGWSAVGLRLLGISIVLFNSFLIFLYGKEFTTKIFAFLMAAFSFFMMNNIFLHATETISEHFMVTFALAGFYLLIKKVFKSYLVNIFIAGFLICSAAMIKQTAAIYGLGAILFLVLSSFQERYYHNKEQVIKAISMLGLGAIFIIFLSFLPILISGSFDDARYWLIEFPSKYVSTISFSDGLDYLNTFVGRAMNFQYYTMIFLLSSILALLINFDKRYFSLLLILLLCSFLNTFPGYRFYGHYWIPFFLILPLCLMGWKDLFAKIKRIKIFTYVLPFVLLLVFCFDLVRKNASYFEEDYAINAEFAYSGNYPRIVEYMLNNVKERILPHETFSVLGTQVEAYLILNRFPSAKHIYPKLISRNSPRNQVYQKEAFKELKDGNPDYIFFSVTGQAWRSTGDFDDWLYNQSFNYVERNYTPMLVYNQDENKFYTPESGKIDLYKPNQLITFKRN